jgi:DNA-binding IclR family transcriptional regulator
VGVLDGRHVVYVERLDSPNTMRVFTRVGRRNDAHCTSSGKALLAFMPKVRRERLLEGWELPSHTEFTITESDGLRKELALIRRQGYAENRQESRLTVDSVAAPIRDGSGAVVASLSLAGPTERFESKRSIYADAVMALARTVSAQMGWSAQD